MPPLRLLVWLAPVWRDMLPLGWRERVSEVELDCDGSGDGRRSCSNSAASIFSNSHARIRTNGQI